MQGNKFNTQMTGSVYFTNSSVIFLVVVPTVANVFFCRIIVIISCVTINTESHTRFTDRQYDNIISTSYQILRPILEHRIIIIIRVHPPELSANLPGVMCPSLYPRSPFLSILGYPLKCRYTYRHYAATTCLGQREVCDTNICPTCGCIKQVFRTPCSACVVASDGQTTVYRYNFRVSYRNRGQSNGKVHLDTALYPTMVVEASHVQVLN